jgi:hypothetical protein
MTTLNKYDLVSETLEFDAEVKSDNSLRVLDAEKDKSDFHFDRTTLLTITDDKNKKIKIRFDWCNYSGTDRIFNTLLIPQTSKLFFGARFFWGVIDLQNPKVDRQEICAEFWNFERHADTIVVITELEAFALNLNGVTIDNVPIDPPFDTKNFDDRIEFESPVYGRQTLKLKE